MQSNGNGRFLLSPGFTLSGVVKVLDFGLANILENASPNENAVYEMSGETGSVCVVAFLVRGVGVVTVLISLLLLLLLL